MSSEEEAIHSETTEVLAAEEPRVYSGSSHAWRALRHRNFRLFFGGQSISLIGTWMTRIEEELRSQQARGAQGVR